MALIEGPSGPYCLDRTEVTQAHYKAFLAEVGTGPITPTEENAYLLDFAKCATTNAAFAIRDGGDHDSCFPLPDAPERPIECIDICDAHAFCRWSGKRLCGQADGKVGTVETGNQPTSSEWMWACTNGGTTKLPMGDVYTSNTCTDQTSVGKGVDWKVGSHAECRGQKEPYSSLVDQLGSVAEFTAECTLSAATGLPVSCMARGGAISDIPDRLSCTSTEATVSMIEGFPGIGIRCCADAVE